MSVSRIPRMDLSDNPNKLIIIGNGFDLAHGLKTSYKDFLFWYFHNILKTLCSTVTFSDDLIEIKNPNNKTIFSINPDLITYKHIMDFLSKTGYVLSFNSIFFQKLLSSLDKTNWVDIELYYYRVLKSYFSNNSFTNKRDVIIQLNKDFDFITGQLVTYLQTISNNMHEICRLDTVSTHSNWGKLFSESNDDFESRFISFNYTDTLFRKYGIPQDEIIHIHGRIADIQNNPVIFGYGDESDPTYQSIEDSGDNTYLEHLKSFGYFRTENYQNLLSFVDSSLFNVYIVGHSCGLSDRVLLREIFESPNCQSIEIFYHKWSNESDNFKEITQEISRHFQPMNKNLMRRKIKSKNPKNIIPQRTGS